MYDVNLTKEEREILDQLVGLIYPRAGVTQIGNRLTVRWNYGNKLVDVHMIIESINGLEEDDEKNQ